MRIQWHAHAPLGALATNFHMHPLCVPAEDVCKAKKEAKLYLGETKGAILTFEMQVDEKKSIWAQKQKMHAVPSCNWAQEGWAILQTGAPEPPSGRI